MKDFTQMFTLASMGFGFMLAFKLLTIQKRGLIDMWLGLYVTLLVGILAEFLMQQNSTALLFIGATYWLVGPFFYWYIKERNSPGQYVFTRDCLVHFIPFFIYLCFVIVARLRGWEMRSDLVNFIFYEAVFIHILSYLISAVKVLWKIKPEKKFGYSKTISFAPIKFIAMASLTFFACSWIATHAMLFVGTQFGGEFQLVVQSGVTFLIFAIAFVNTSQDYKVHERS